MTSIVIDASIASAWCFVDEQTEYTRMVFHAVSFEMVHAVAPQLWAYEIRNSLLMAVRRALPLATLDKRLVKAAREASVAVFAA